ncbi:PREDICTED: uncharacterized protein At4g14450, chloroplastic-like [Ipomoea nil]|uniref:uncharacterized protein At4g14450, chloroplastic-like n=1 Tax=Ipomoea nil TaxID=35883 RepID=UPI00090187B8|nr:PREDICTED: uncharacterized protein At4g14450, chloroplastic-like [Ipomoea nil]
MAESKYLLPEQRQPSELMQRRAQSSMQINCAAAHWNVAIPLLSPLVSSLESRNDLPAANNLYSNSSSSSNIKDELAKKEPEKPPPSPAVFKRWQHPAMPFCHEQAPPFVPFIPRMLID